jgi:hypothetical protein
MCVADIDCPVFCQFFQHAFDSGVADIVAIDQKRNSLSFLHKIVLLDALKFFRLAGYFEA